MKLSGLILVKNNERSIEYALKSIADYMDEIVVLDSGSTDKTLDIAAHYTKNIYYHEFGNNFAQQKNFGMKQCHGDWIFILDSDEIVGEKFSSAFSFLNRGYRSIALPRYRLVHVSPMQYITIRPHFFDWQLRFIRNDGNCYYESTVHEALQNYHRRLRFSLTHIFHLDLLLNDYSARQKKVAYYDKLRLGAGYPRMYLFEDYPYKTANVMEQPSSEVRKLLQTDVSLLQYDLHTNAMIQTQQWLRDKLYNGLTRLRGAVGI